MTSPRDTLDRAFTATARRQPDAVALISGDEVWTYRQLDARADRIAAELSALGVGAAHAVGVAAARGPDFVAALLGALKTGAHYLALPAELPAARLAQLARAADVAAIVTDGAATLEGVPDRAPRLTVGAGAAAPPHASTDPNALAYLMFTSGSTGIPKGVAIEHHGVCEYAGSLARALAIGPADRWLHTASFAFSASVRQLFVPLLAGAGVVLARHEELEPAKLLALGARAGVTIFDTVPTYLRALVRALPGLDAPVIEALGAQTRWLLTTGEPFANDAAATWARTVGGGARFANLYGQTETSGTVALYLMDAPPAPGVAVPVGRARDGLEIEVVDDALEPVAPGAVGELYVTGACVARGYHGDAARTAARFVAAACAGGPRGYRTGDRGRRRADGLLEWLGRVDDQVKIRGQRVEPSEVGARLRELLGITEAIVIAETSTGEPRLCAYYVGDAEVATVRAALTAALPSYMVPSTFVVLDELPRTTSGKIDRAQLAIPTEAPAPTGTPPRTAEEQALASIFGELLARQTVGVEEDFFACGGHSLLAAELCARLRATFEIELPLSAIFEAPTVAALAERLAEARGDAPRSPPQRRATGDAPATRGQEGLWFLATLDPASTAYHIVDARWREELDQAALSAAFGDLIRRHEALRTRLQARGEAIEQVICDEDAGAALAADGETITSETADTPEAARLRLASLAARPLSLETAPLWRAAIIDVPGEGTLVGLIIHHVVADGWSLEVLWRDLERCYEARRRGLDPALPPPPLQFGDWTSWERAHGGDGTRESGLAYWERHLAGLDAALALPTDRPRADRPGPAGEVALAIPRRTTRALAALARRHRCTLPMAILAALDVALARLSGSIDVAVGVPVARRPYRELADTVGFFVNTLPVRVAVDPAADFAEILRRVRAASLGAYAHEHVPFESIVARCAPAREIARNPLFQAMLVWASPEAASRFGEPVSVPSRESKVDLTLTVREARDGGLAATLEYDRSLWDAASGEALARRFATLLEAIVAAPECPVGRLLLLDASERDALLALGAGERHPVEGTVVELFAARLAAGPSREAVRTTGGRSFTYAELDRWSNAVARRLAPHLGVTGARVGIATGRGPAQLAALLATLKLGAAYVPLGRDEPLDRRQLIAADAGLAAVLCDDPGDPLISALELPTIVVDDRTWAEDDAPPGEPPPPAHVRSPVGDDIAYVLYTSGSTGRPKGVLGTHRGIVNRLQWMWRRYPFAAGEVCAQKTALGFVDAVWEIFGPLCAGVPLVIVSDEAFTDPSALVVELAAHDVTRVVVVPSLLRAMLAVTPRLGAALPALQMWTSSGEPLAPALVRSFRAAVGERPRLLNLFGCAEAAADSTWAELATVEGETPVPVGRPIDNHEVVLVDDALELVPPGAPGEICLAGAGLAAGYVSSPSLTAARFVPHPLRPGERLYRTGDIGRWAKDGALVHLGRKDDQVKIRGQRVELDEVRGAIAQLDGVRESYVTVRRHDDEVELVAYWAGPATTATIHGALRARLPRAMVPTRYLRLPALPRTPSGKVDRTALPSPTEFEAAELAAELPASPPRSPLEGLLAAAFAEVLGLAAVGRDDDFFALGGHSLLVARLVARLRDVLAAAPTVRDVFDAPTVAALATLLAGRDAPRRTMTLSSSGATKAPATFAQQRLWFVAKLEPASVAYQIVQGRLAGGDLPATRLTRALTELAARHAALRLRFVEQGEVLWQELEPAPHVELDEARAADLAAAGDLAQRFAARPIDRSRGPLWRALLVHLDSGDALVVLVLDHLIADGWSMEILWRDLAWSCAGDDDLPRDRPTPLGFIDWARWEDAALTEAALEGGLAYWKEHLDGYTDALELPSDAAPDAARTGRGRRRNVELPPRAVEALRALAQRERCSLYMTTLGALAVVLSRVSGRMDLVIGCPVAGRRRVEVEETVGLFVNTLPLRVDLEGSSTVRALLAHVREVALAGFAHEHVPFERVVAVAKPARELDHHPLFQVMLNGMPMPAAAEGPARGFQAVELPVTDARLPLTFYLRDDRDGVRLSLVYDLDRFSDARAEALLAQLAQVLEAFAADRDGALDDICLASGAELALVTAVAPLPRPHHEPVHRQVAAQAARAPDAPAVERGGACVTYGALTAASDRIGELLRDAGIRRGEVVAVTGARSAGGIAAVLAVLDGFVLFTLDAQLPAARTAELLHAAGARWVISAGPPRPDLEALGVGLLVVDPDGLAPRLTTRPATGPESPPRGEDEAYIFFTSGTTGRPKAIVGSHQGLAHFIDWQRAEFGVGAEDRVAWTTGWSFDVVLRDLFLPLSAGATLCVPAVEPGLSWLREAAVTRLHVVPTVAHAWLTADGDAVHPGTARRDALRTVFFAGEPLSAALVARWRSAFPAAEIVNLYGPTETTLAKFFYRVPPGALPPVQPVGRPLPQTQGLVLAERRRLCGIGEVGEVCVRTPFASHGYLEPSSDERGRFFSSPFAPTNQERLFATGDRGRLRPDGVLELLGRDDDQVKIHGARVEPAEVAAVIESHPSVAACVVRPALRGAQAALAAYVVAAPGGELDLRALRRHVGTRLPSYMVPAAFVVLEALPRTANGKVDRARLPAPTFAAPAPEDSTGARTALEQVLLDLYRDVLELDVVGIHDSFFDLGGHSLSAAQLIARVRAVLGIDLPLRAIFAAPTVAGLVSHLEGEAGAAAAPMPIAPRSSAEAPASYGQRRLWFLAQIEPGSAAYHIAQARWLDGPAEVAALRRALAAVYARHEALRTAFVRRGEHLTQTIARTLEAPLTTSTAASRAEATARLTQEARIPFDLRHPPLWRAHAVIVPGRGMLVGFVVHHIIADGWSMGLLWRELLSAYAVGADPAADLSAALGPAPALQYGDWASWEASARASERLEEGLSYWREELRDHSGVLNLPSDRSFGERARAGATRVRVALEPALVARLSALARGAGATLHMALLTAFGAFLSRVGGDRDLVIGTPVAGRGDPRLEGTIGFFVNTLPLRLRLPPGASFGELVAQVRDAALGAYAHDEVPFEKIVEALAPARDLGRNPLFQAMFTWAGGLTSALPGDAVAIDIGDAKLDVNLSLGPQAGGAIGGNIEWAEDLWDAETAAHLTELFERVLRRLTDEPALSVDEVPLVDTAELAAQRALGAGEARPPSGTIVDWFGAQRALAPDAIAVREASGAAFSYAALDRFSAALAADLARRELGPEAVIGIAVGRGLAQVGAVLAVVRAGMAYVPLSPELPVERRAWIARDAEVRAIIVDAATEAWASTVGVPTIDVATFDPDADATVDTTGAVPARTTLPEGIAPTPASLAYLLYTSGSTGRAKGVLGLHASLINRLAWMWRRYPFAPGEVCAQKTSLSFVDSVAEIFGALGGGVPLVVLSDEATRDPRRMIEELATHAVTRIVLVPSLLQALIALAPTDLGERLPRLRYWSVSGERLTRPLVEAFRRAVGDDRVLLNLYGASEAGADSTWADLSTWSGDRDPPIGRPIDNTEVLVLDEHGRPVPTGLPGEICLAGAGLARGYRGAPALTAERFVAHPRGDGALMYRTGDLGRWLADGQLAYLGRRDDQVKLRGQRVELAEVIAALRRIEGVVEGTVVASGEGAGTRLVAYVVTKRPLDELRTQLAAWLPPYMVPSSFVRLAALPRTPSGKIDRPSLPAPGADAATRAATAPRTEEERALAALFGELLGRDQIGVGESFFDLGGHSLLAAQLAAEIERRFGRRIPLALLFRLTTVASLAPLLAATDPAHSPRLVPLVRRPAKPTFVLVHPIGGTVFCYQELARQLEERDVWGIQARGVDGEAPPQEDLVAMAEEYVEVVLQLVPEGPIELGGWSMGGVVAFAMARELARRGRPVEHLVLLDAPATPPRGEAPPAVAGSRADVLAAHHRALLHFAWGRHDGPTLVVRAEPGKPLGSSAWEQHLYQPTLTRVAADHESLLQTPAIDTVVASVRRFLDSAP